MPSILFVKTSSLGDVVHNCPAVSDAARAIPGAQIDWVVEEPLRGVHADEAGDAGEQDFHRSERRSSISLAYFM